MTVAFDAASRRPEVDWCSVYPNGCQVVNGETVDRTDNADKRLTPATAWTEGELTDDQICSRWEFFAFFFDGSPDAYYAWQAGLMAERAPA